MQKKWIIILSISLVIYFLVFPFHKIYSFTCNQATISSSHSSDEWNQIINACSQQYTQQNSQIYDAKVQAEALKTKRDLIVAQIKQTEQKIDETQKEIDILNSRISGLDTSLDYLSKLMVQRIADGYKNRNISLLSLLFDSKNVSELFDRIKYLKTAQDNNQKFLVQVQRTKLNFEEQKKLRDDKKVELDNLKTLLASQQVDLERQQRKLDEYLTQLASNLAETQRLLDIAQAQAAAFKSFVSSTGVGIISANQFGNGSDGNYYSQRDSRWANKTIGSSNETILNVGCLVTSVAMFAKKLGLGSTPLDIASDINRFYGSTAYMNLPWPSIGGKSYRSLSQSDADEQLQNGNYVIAGIRRYSCASGGDHFIILTKKQGNDYIMHDPIYGPDQKFNDHYSSFCSFATFN